MSQPRKRILIRQAKEWGEILVGIETRNRYELFDEGGRRIAHAAEEGGGVGRVLGRMFLGSSRKATLHVLDETGRTILRGEKPFTWFFHRLELHDGERKLGAVQRRWSWFNRRFTVENARGEAVFEIVSPFLSFWTFRLLFGEREVGVIRKQWGGVLRELFTDADAFGVEYEDLPDLEVLRPLLIGAVFLVDFTCFEGNQGGGAAVLGE